MTPTSLRTNAILLYIISLAGWVVAAFITLFMFDSPGASNNLWTIGLAFSTLIYGPVVIVSCALAAIKKNNAFLKWPLAVIASIAITFVGLMVFQGGGF